MTDTPTYLPEGMETTATQRAGWKGNPYPHGAEHYLAQASRDIDRALAEVARLTAALTDEAHITVSLRKMYENATAREQRAREEERAALRSPAAEPPPDRERLIASLDELGTELLDAEWDAVELINDTLVALRSPADGWRSIESAPKDKRIEIGGPSGYVEPHGWHQESAHWEQRSQQRPGPICWRTDSGDAYNDGWPNPTHWRPLPAPPAEEKTP